MLHASTCYFGKLVPVLLGVLVLIAPLNAGTPEPTDSRLAVEDFSPGFLGMYRKVMEIEDDIDAVDLEGDEDLDVW